MNVLTVNAKKRLREVATKVANRGGDDVDWRYFTGAAQPEVVLELLDLAETHGLTLAERAMLEDVRSRIRANSDGTPESRNQVHLAVLDKLLGGA